VFWCKSQASSACSDPRIRRDCCQTCASTPTHVTSSTTSHPVTRYDVTRRKSNSAGLCPPPSGDAFPSFCVSMPSYGCYHFPRVCCHRCSKQLTRIPGTACTSATVGRVAQWLGRWSLAGWTFLAMRPIYGWQMATLLSKLSAMGRPTRTTQPSIPLGSVNE